MTQPNNSVPWYVVMTSVLNGRRSEQFNLHGVTSLNGIIIAFALVVQGTYPPNNPKGRRRLAQSFTRAVCREQDCSQKTFEAAARTIVFLGYGAEILEDLFKDNESPPINEESQKLLAQALADASLLKQASEPAEIAIPARVD